MRRESCRLVDERCVRFVPSSVEGLPDVTEVAVFTDRVELLSAGRWVVIRYLAIAVWCCLGGVYGWLARHGLGVYGKPAVAERDWFHPPTERYFCFLTTPRILVFMPEEADPEAYFESTFAQIGRTIDRGDFNSFDMG